MELIVEMCVHFDGEKREMLMHIPSSKFALFEAETPEITAVNVEKIK